MLKDLHLDDNTSHAHYLAAVKVAEILNSHNFQAYFIGGAVRDMLLGATPKDFDVVTDASPSEILSLDGLEQSKFKDTAQAFGVTRTIVKIDSQVVEVEIATYRNDIEAHLGRTLTKVEFSTLDDDVNRRDLTVNALAYDPITYELIDHVEGLKDLDAKTIRFIGEPLRRIHEDPLRILRAIRLKNQLAFQYSKETKKAIIEAVKLEKIDTIATDRVRDELSRMFTDKNRKQAILDLEKLGVLKHLIPELRTEQGVDQPKKFHSEGDVWAHTLIAIDQLPKRPSKRLVWATLLHDIGKPATKTEPEGPEGRIRFDNHAQMGAEIAGNVLRRLKFSNRDREDICWMVHYHMTIGDLSKMSRSRQHHYMRHRAFADLLELHKADVFATWGPSNSDTSEKRSYIKSLEKIWEDYQYETQHHEPNIKDDLGINGAWIMKEFKIPAGPRLGVILDKLQEAYLDKEISSKQEARNYIESL